MAARRSNECDCELGHERTKHRSVVEMDRKNYSQVAVAKMHVDNSSCRFALRKIPAIEWERNRPTIGHPPRIVVRSYVSTVWLVIHVSVLIQWNEAQLDFTCEGLCQRSGTPCIHAREYAEHMSHRTAMCNMTERTLGTMVKHPMPSP